MVQQGRIGRGAFLIRAIAAGGAEAKRAFEALMEMGKIDIAKIEAARNPA